MPPVSVEVTPLVVPPRDACRLLSIGMSRLYDLMRSGELSSYLDGRSRRITMKAIHEYVARRVADAEASQPCSRAKTSLCKVGVSRHAYRR
jgi:excisionase family DNA binding protein